MWREECAGGLAELSGGASTSLPRPVRQGSRRRIRELLSREDGFVNWTQGFGRFLSGTKGCVCVCERERERMRC